MTEKGYTDALTSFDNCLKLDDKFKFAYYACACIHHEFDNHELALQNWEKARSLEGITNDKEHQKDEHGYYARGLARYQIGQDNEGAIEDLEKVQEIAMKHQYKSLEEKAIVLLQKIKSKGV